MAHQAHNIPWSLLTSNLRWFSANPASGCTNLRQGTKKPRGKELMHFLEAFARNIKEHSACERRKYPETYDPPEPTEVVIDARTATTIGRTVRRWRHFYRPGYHGAPSWACRRERHDKCQCHVLPKENRRVAAFLHQYVPNPCHAFWPYNEDYYTSVELIKTLLLYGEMDPIFRVCAHPLVNLRLAWRMDVCGCGAIDLGFDQLCKSFLVAYIGLNVLYCFPEL